MSETKTDLNNFTLMQPDSIRYVKDKKKMYDITVEDTNTFFIKTKNDYSILTHNCDPDGIGHIASLVVNLFFKWFPKVIEEGRLNILITPLVSAEVANRRKYFYSLQQWADFEKTGTPFKGVRYLKGLGSLSVEDWQIIMIERKMFRIRHDRSATKYIDIAFGTNSDKRKRWLEGRI